MKKSTVLHFNYRLSSTYNHITYDIPILQWSLWYSRLGYFDSILAKNTKYLNEVTTLL